MTGSTFFTNCITTVLTCFWRICNSMATSKNLLFTMWASNSIFIAFFHELIIINFQSHNLSIYIQIDLDLDQQMKRSILILAVLLVICLAQSQKASKRNTSNQSGQSQNLFVTIANFILGGPSDVPILQKILNKISYFGTVLLGSVFAYFKWFRQKKNRLEKISEYIGDQKHQFALSAQKQAANIGEKVAQKIIYDLNSQKKRLMAVKTSNEAINYNIDIKVDDVIEESLLIYNIHITGTQPQGMCKMSGFVTFKNKLMEVRLEKTYERCNRNKQDSPICLFQGKQIREGENLIAGEWWIENQRSTKGVYSGSFTFSF